MEGNLAFINICFFLSHYKHKCYPGNVTSAANLANYTLDISHMQMING